MERVLVVNALQVLNTIKKIPIFLCGWTNFFVKKNPNKTKKDENIEKKI